MKGNFPLAPHKKEKDSEEKLSSLLPFFRRERKKQKPQTKINKKRKKTKTPRNILRRSILLLAHVFYYLDPSNYSSQLHKNQKKQKYVIEISRTLNKNA
jgi:hypothetical protein